MLGEVRRNEKKEEKERGGGQVPPGATPRDVQLCRSIFGVQPIPGDWSEQQAVMDRRFSPLPAASMTSLLCANLNACQV